MRILIVGASGLVGGNLYQEFLSDKNHPSTSPDSSVGTVRDFASLRKKTEAHILVGTYHHYKLPHLVPLDITRGKEVTRIISEFKPEVVLHPAAFADVDGCEKNPELCQRINSIGVRNVIDACGKVNSLFVFFSTDYVFDGKNGPYREEDKTNPLSVYGRVKLEIENYLRKKHPNHLIIRTCGVFGQEVQGKNFVVRLIDKLKNNQEVSIVTDQQGSPTYVKSLTAAVSYLVENGYQGRYHVTGTSVLMRYDFALLIAKVFKLDQNLIKPITTDQIQQTALRPLLGGLTVDKVQKILPFKLLSAREGLEEMGNENLL